MQLMLLSATQARKLAVVNKNMLCRDITVNRYPLWPIAVPFLATAIGYS